MATGLVASVRRPSARPELVFVHLAALSTFVFWVLLYRWLDQRFLLYFVPFLTVYFALGVERLVAIGRAWLSATGARVVAAAVAIVVWGIGASVTAAPLPLSSFDYVPVAPGLLLHFEARHVGDFGGNTEIVLDPPPERVAFTQWGTSPFAYYRRLHRRDLSGLVALRDELFEAGRAVEASVPRDASIAVCTDALWEHATRHRILHALRRNLVPSCDARSRFVIAERASHTPPPEARLLHSGQRFLVYERSEL
jgi:hypothetical protein